MDSAYWIKYGPRIFNVIQTSLLKLGYIDVSPRFSPILFHFKSHPLLASQRSCSCSCCCIAFHFSYILLYKMNVLGSVFEQSYLSKIWRLQNHWIKVNDRRNPLFTTAIHLNSISSTTHHTISLTHCERCVNVALTRLQWMVVTIQKAFS